MPTRSRREHHSRERYYACSLESGEAGHRVGTHARQEGRERWHPPNQRKPRRVLLLYRATKQRATFLSLVLIGDGELALSSHAHFVSDEKMNEKSAS